MIFISILYIFPIGTSFWRQTFDFGPFTFQYNSVIALTQLFAALGNLGLRYSLVTACYCIYQWYWDIRIRIHLSLSLSSSIVQNSMVRIQRHIQTQRLSKLDVYSQLVPITLAIGFAVAWSVHSPSQLLQSHPTSFLLTVGFVIANLVVSLDDRIE